MGFIYIKKKSKSKLYFAQLIVMVKMLTKTFVRFVTQNGLIYLKSLCKEV